MQNRCHVVFAYIRYDTSQLSTKHKHACTKPLGIHVDRYLTFYFFSSDKESEGIPINLEDVQLHSNECTKLLGVHVDRYLTFNHHVSELCRKSARQVNCLM